MCAAKSFFLSNLVGISVYYVKMEISALYKALLDNPHAPKPYRDLRTYYEKLGKHDEANAFTFLLKEVFDELPSAPWGRLDADMPDTSA